MVAFAESITFVGAPLDPPVGNADTVMERLEDGKIGAEIPTRLVAFANVSAAPIRLAGSGRLAGYYDLYVTLSPVVESPGRSIFRSDDGVSGTFESELSLSPLFELRPLGGGDSIFVDTGVTPIPGFPMRLGSAGGAWSRRPTSEAAVGGFRSRALFYPGAVSIRATRDAQDAPVSVSGDVTLLAACDKVQAEFVTTDRPGRFARVNYPTPKPGANRELT